MTYSFFFLRIQFCLTNLGIHFLLELAAVVRSGLMRCLSDRCHSKYCRPEILSRRRNFLTTVFTVTPVALRNSNVLIENPLSCSQITKVSVLLVYPVNKCVCESVVCVKVLCLTATV